MPVILKVNDIYSPYPFKRSNISPPFKRFQYSSSFLFSLSRALSCFQALLSASILCDAAISRRLLS